MDDQTHYSLCQSIRTRAWDGKIFHNLLRLADIAKPAGSQYYGVNTKEFTSTLITDDRIPALRYLYELSPNELGIWEWDIHEDKDGVKKQYTKRKCPEATYYEVYLPETVGIPPSDSQPQYRDIFERLINGIAVPSYITPPFLLVISEMVRQYQCVYITKENSQFQNGKLSIPNKTPVTIYTIPKSDCIQSAAYIENYIYRGQLDEEFIPRIIYVKRRFPVSPKPIDITIQTLSSYFAEYVDSVVANLPNHGEVAESIHEFLEEGALSEDTFKEYLFSTSSDEEAQKMLVSYACEYKDTETALKNYLKKKASDPLFISDLIERIPELRDKYIDRIHKKYLSEIKQKAQEDINSLTSEKAGLELCLIGIRAEIETGRQEIENISEENNQLEIKHAELEKSVHVLAEDMTEKTKDLRETLETLKNVLQIPTPGQTGSEMPRQKITKRHGYSTELNEAVELDEWKAVRNRLEANLDTVGFYDKEWKITSMIAGSHLQHVPLILVGSCCDEVSYAISISLTAKPPEIFCLPTGFNDYETLVSEMKKSESDYIVLENILGTSEEYCYLHVEKDVPDKHIIFMADFESTLRLLPKEIYGHALLINTDDYLIEMPKKEALTPGILTISEGDTDDSSLDKMFEMIEEFRNTRDKRLPKGYSITRAKILSFPGIKPEDIPDYLGKELQSIECDDEP